MWLNFATLMGKREKSGDLMESLNIRNLRKRTLAFRKFPHEPSASGGGGTWVSVGSTGPPSTLRAAHSGGHAFRKIVANGEMPHEDAVRSGNRTKSVN